MKSDQIILGKDSSIDVWKLVEQRLLIQANSGGGKSWLIRRLLENSHGMVQQIVIDLEGEFASLREKYDYLLVGREGDVPADIQTSSTLAKRLLELHADAIVDLSELKKHERIIFVKRFLDSMINSPKNLWHPVLVVIDEAHQFCPEKERSESTSSVIDVCTRGRKRGFCAVLATQRLSKLNKDAAAECNNKLIGRTGLDVDMKRASEELGFSTKEDRLSLRKLHPGQFYAFGPAISTEVIKIEVGKVSTTHPQTGVRMQTTPISTSNSIRKIVEHMQDLVEQSHQEATTLDEYKREVQQLKTQLSIQKRLVQQPVVNVVGDVRDQKEIIHLKGVVRDFEKRIRSIAKSAGNIHRLTYMDETTFQPEIVETTEKEVKRVLEDKPATPGTCMNGKNTLRLGAMRMLKAVASFHPKTITKHQIATVAGLSVKSGTFSTYLSELRRQGWVQETMKGLYNVSDEGIEAAGSVESMPTSHEHLLEMWKRKFRAGASRILEVVAQEYPDGLTRSEIGERTDMSMSSGTFLTYLSELRRNGLIEERNGEIKATKELFPENEICRVP